MTAAPIQAAAAQGIVGLPIPTPFAVGRVNVYLIEDDPLTLVDTGPNSGKALDELETALAGRGHRIEDLRRIVISHQHIDHLGLTSILRRRSGAEVCALDLLAPLLSGFKDEMEADDAGAEELMLRHGLSRDVTTALRSVSRAFRGWGGTSEVDTLLRDGDALHFRDRSLKVLHRPGHSPSDTVLWDERTKTLLAADHLIKHISSNPLIHFRPVLADAPRSPSGRPQALKIYMESLRRTRDMDLDIVLPGHGEPIVGDHVAIIDGRFEMHHKRAGKIGRMIRESGGGALTAHEVAQRLWGNVAVTQAFLTMCEVLGHADLLMDSGEIREIEDEDGVAHFEAVSA